MKARELASRIDHTNLLPDATELDIRRLCSEAVEQGFATVCVMPYHVTRAVDAIMELKQPQQDDIPVASVVGFPNGTHLPDIKEMEARYALEDGATELDVTMNLAAFKAGEIDAVIKELNPIVDIAHDRDVIVKVIIETGLLNDDEVRRACDVVHKTGADFVKTSTGIYGEGATVDRVRFIRDCLGDDEIGIKASGGVKTAEDAVHLIEAGADRIGSSQSVHILSTLSP